MASGQRFQGEAVKLTVVHSSCVQSADGTTAILLMTKEAGPIAFAVDERAIAALRRDLTECEVALGQKAGRA